MRTQNRNAILALAGAGLMWGLSVPLSKLALAWLAPGWLTVARFLAAAPPLAVAGRRGLREALAPRVALGGAIGFGAVIVLQNAGIQRTSVSHAAVLIGAVPVLVALIGAGLGHAGAGGRAWAGYGLALLGIALVAGSGAGGGATVHGDLLVLGSATLSASFIAVQPRLLEGRDPAAVTAVQLTAGAALALAFALVFEPLPRAPAGPTAALALAGLAVAGTLIPFWLFAYGQSHVSPQLAGAFINLEPVVGAAVGWFAFGDPAARSQLAGAAAVLVGIALSTVPRRAPVDRRLAPTPVELTPPRPPAPAPGCGSLPRLAALLLPPVPGAAARRARRLAAAGSRRPAPGTPGTPSRSTAAPAARAALARPDGGRRRARAARRCAAARPARQPADRSTSADPRPRPSC